MKVIVTGGAGFIGSHLCARLLTDGHEVLCIDNFLTSNVRNIEDLKKNPTFSILEHDVIKPLPTGVTGEAVFHLASPASPNHHSKISYHALPLETMQVNTTGTFNLLEFCEKNKARFLFASTSEAYGDPLEHPQTEEYRGNVSTTGPRSVYDEAKRYGETIVSYFVRSRGVNARIARIFNTYGPHLEPEDMRMVVRFITQAIANEPITVFGDGTQTRSLCYVTDTVDGLMKLMFTEKTEGEVVNIGAQEEHTVYEYAEIIKNIVGSSSTITLSEELPTDDPLRRRADISKAKRLLGWQPTVSLESGLKSMIAYVQSL